MVEGARGVVLIEPFVTLDRPVIILGSVQLLSLYGMHALNRFQSKRSSTDSGVGPTDTSVRHTRHTHTWGGGRNGETRPEN